MSDSLRDQLVNAGFKAPKPESKPAAKSSTSRRGKKRSGKHEDAGSGKKRPLHSDQQSGRASKKQDKQGQTPDADSSAEIAKRKALKESIKLLIDTHKIKDHSGTFTYSYQVGNRVKQLFVSEECRQKLSSAQLVITRLNGSTWLIPPEIGQQIFALNPDWALHDPGANSSDSTGNDDEYADHIVPDDLIW